MASRNRKIDIHNYDRQYEATRKSVGDADISRRNKELILEFERNCFPKEATSKPRRIKLMSALMILARDYTRCDFDKMDKKAIEKVLFKINSREDYSPWTKQSYRAIIKKFFKWLCQGDEYKTILEYPPIVNWINTNIKKKDKPRVQASDLLTELEVKRLMDVAEHPRDKCKPMEYGTFRKLIFRLKEKAEIKKRLYPHLFRHTRVTHLLTNKQINEAQAKVYFGWVPSSTMLSEYSHLISSDVNNAILEIHGIKTSESKESLLKPKQCPGCSAINAKDARFCQKCGGILDVDTALELDDQRSRGDELMSELVKDPLIQKTLMKKIIEMGLGDKLLKGIGC